MNALELFLSGYTSKSTKSAYRKDLADFLSFCPDLTTLTLIKLEEYRAALNVQGLCATSVNRKLSAVRAYLSWLTRTNQLEYGVGATGQLLRGVRTPERLPDSLTSEQLRSLLNVPQDLRGRTALWLLATSGIRIAELVELQIANVNLTKREATVFGKGSKERIVIFSPKTATLLREYIGERKSGPVFTNKHGQQITPRFFQYELRAWGEAAGIARLHPHMLRHTFATKALDETGDIQFVQTMLGHKDISTTTRYVGAATKRLHKAYSSVFGEED